jgi:nucleotide-binding universal stress UspA family protein
MLDVRTILHPTDFSECCAPAFELACAVARDYGVRLVLLHVRQSAMMPMGEFGVLPPDSEDFPEALQKKLDRLQPLAPDVPVERLLKEGNPAPEIVRTAREQKCQLIVMGTHGRTGLARLLMGSVAEEVLRQAPCPVLIVKPPPPGRVPVWVSRREPAVVE